jgi:hypothetical protein
MNDSRARTSPYWWQTVAPSVDAGGWLGILARPNRGSGILEQFDPPDRTWDRSTASWADSEMPFGRAGGIPGLPAQPIDQPWFNPAPEKSGPAAWNAASATGVDWLALARKAAEPITSYPGTYSQMNREAQEQVAHGIEQIKGAYEPGVRDPIGFVTGLGNVGLGAVGYVASPISATLRTIAGKPLEETVGIPKEYTEFALSLGIPGLGLRSGFPARPAASPTVVPRDVVPRSPLYATEGVIPAAPAVRSSGQGLLFDYSRLHETPNVRQFDLDRYAPPRGVPERIQALANRENVERVNEVVQRGADQGGRAFYNTEPLREAFLAERGAARGQTGYDKYFDLVGATSPGSRVGENIRNASYQYARSEQGLPPLAPRWDGSKWTLPEPLPWPYGHIAQGLHAKKVNEVLEQGGLAPITNPKIASFVQNLRGNQMPVTIDRHNTRQWGVADVSGRPVDIPPQVGYGFLERLQQTEAAKMGLAPAQYQASAWIGGAHQTGVRSRLAPWLDTFETRVALTAEKLGLTKEETLRRFIRGELPLYSLAGAAAIGAAAPDALNETDE